MAPKMNDDGDVQERVELLEAAIVDIHQVLYPERYWGSADRELMFGQFDEEGYLQWNSDTPDLIDAQLRAIHRAYKIPGIVTDPTPLP